MRKTVRNRVVLVSLSVVLVGVLAVAAAATGSTKRVRASADPTTSHAPEGARRSWPWFPGAEATTT